MSKAEKLKTIAENEQKVFDAGKKEQFSELMDVIQFNGASADYTNRFYRWNRNVFYPKYDIKCIGCISTFHFFEQNGEPFDFAQRLKECGVTLDVSQCANASYTFYWSCFSTIPELNFSKASYLTRVFMWCKNLKSIENLIVSGNCQFNYVFDYCTELENLKITGTIGNAFNIRYSTKLSRASLLSILNACNKEGLTTAINITLPINCIDGATDTETFITSDTELNSALATATALGYTILYKAV